MARAERGQPQQAEILWAALALTRARLSLGRCSPGGSLLTPVFTEWFIISFEDSGGPAVRSPWGRGAGQSPPCARRHGGSGLFHHGLGGIGKGQGCLAGEQQLWLQLTCLRSCTARGVCKLFKNTLPLNGNFPRPFPYVSTGDRLAARRG